MDKFFIINRKHILDAIQWFDRSQRPIEKSWTTYSLFYKEKYYPPREIAKKALSFVYKNIGDFYDIEDALELFQKCNFKIVRKNEVWKLGCNWGSGQPSFYELIKKEKVVLGRKEKGVYQENDLILITEGFTVRAIGQIKKGKARDLTGEVLDKFRKYNVYASEQIFYKKIEFYELSSSRVFNYELQQGIIKARSFPILVNTDNLWTNRKKNIKEISFKKSSDLDYKTKFPVILYSGVNWNDDIFETIFQFTLFYSPNCKIEIGSVKIGKENQDYKTRIPEQFKSLRANYFSLGVATKYYERLVELFPNIFNNILNSLNDVAKDKSLLKKYRSLDVFQKSFLRSSESEYIIDNYENIITSKTKEWSENFSFSFRIGNAFEDHKVNFTFENFTSNNYRFHCVVGKNATGKTKYLSQFANKLVDNAEEGIFQPKRPYFSKVIAASFSYFDKFKFPTKQDTNYEFIGIKNTKGITDEQFNSSKIWHSYKNIVSDKKKADLWFKCIESSLETEYLDFDLKEISNVSNRKKFIDQTENIFSSGQNIIFNFITRYLEAIETNSILIFDEPETHLHPNIAGRLIRTIHIILNEYSSFCILATHSPVIVQEIPSKYIRIFDRQDDTPIIYSPAIECFGENLSEISNTVFKVDEEKELYKKQLDELIDEGKTFKDINDLFDHGLSLNARVYLLSKMESKS